MNDCNHHMLPDHSYSCRALLLISRQACLMLNTRPHVCISEHAHSCSSVCSVHKWVNWLLTYVHLARNKSQGDVLASSLMHMSALLCSAFEHGQSQLSSEPAHFVHSTPSPCAASSEMRRHLNSASVIKALGAFSIRALSFNAGYQNPIWCWQTPHLKHMETT